MPDPMPIDPTDQVFNMDEAAEFLRVSRSTLERSDVPRAKVGGRVLFRRSVLLRYVQQREGRAA